MTLNSLIEQEQSEIQWQASRLPLPGLADWFLATYSEQLDENESTMDKVGPAMASFYPEAKAVPQ